MKKNYSKLFLFVVLMCSFQIVIGQTQEQKEEITSRYDKGKLNQLQQQLQQKAQSQKQNALQAASIRSLPLIVEANGTYAELQRIAPDGTPIYYTTFNVAAAKSTRADHLNSGGSLGLNLMGQSMTAHVWDGGLARSTHQEYDGAGGNNRFSIGDGSSALHYHSAHVTGTIMASGVQANAKGMAPHANAIGYDWNSDKAEATTAAASGMLISNHSYGYATRNQFGQVQLPQHYFGGYIDETRDWDEILFNAPNYLMVVAAGNDGNDDTANNNPTGGAGFDKLTGHSVAKNNLVVANAQDANIDSNGNLVSVSINSSSSEGPTDDFRIKPDITGNGTSLYSTYESSDTAYNSITGTSMASPNVAGSLVLLQQHHNNVNGSFMKAATLKGLTLHTADDAGATGPDAVFGWGLMHTKRAAEAITQNGNESKIEERTLISGQSYSVTVDSDGINSLMASISWTDRAGTSNTVVNSTTPVLVNDLDIRVTKGGSTYMPYELTGALTSAQQDNNVDPYERVDITGATGTYTITVTHKGSLVGGSQNFSLVVTGLTGIPVVCNATTPTGLNIDGFGSSTATVSWNAVAGATYDLRYRETGTSTWTTNAIAGASTSLSGLTPLTQYEVQVRSKCPDSSTSAYTGSAVFTTTEVQLNYCASQSSNINDEYIGRVQLNTIDNASGGQFYTDFTSISTSLDKSAQYTITITPTWTGTIYSEGYAVWIDYNKDGDFADSGEQVMSLAATQATPVSASFTVPAGASDGATRMRVSMSYNATPTSCQSFTYGEVEDYTVSIGAGTPDTTKPVITLVGSSPVNINVGDTYNDQGATASDNIDGDISSNIVTVNPVDTNTAGSYVVTYNVSDAAGNAADQVTRTVNVNTVVDTTKPVITLIGASPVNVNVGDTYNDQGATASDNVDGDITSNIVTVNPVDSNTAGTYVVTYNVSDAEGNAADQVTRTVNVNTVADTTAPVITLIGASVINLTVGDIYNELGATASDNVDGDISANLVITGTVNTAVAGTYTRYYNVSDAAGNAANQVSRTVNVSEPSSGCSGGVSSYPYTESFENTLGAWTQSTADDINWTVDSAGTPSSNTGPSSGSAGSYYVYVEASSPNYPSKRAILNSPCFDLSGMTSPTFDFDYHMYGATDMGTIDLEASTDEGGTWTSIWSESGNKGNSWQSASIDLSAYAGGTLQLRFNRNVGSTWQADIAIDNINLSEPAAPTCSDGIQNGDETGVDCGGSSCAPCSTGDVVLHQGFFESGWDGWVDGGSDSFRYSGSRSYEGSYSIRLRDNTGSSVMTLSNVDVSPYAFVDVEFYFYPNSMENNEDFWLQYYNGSSYTTVASYAAGTSFTNGSFYTATVTLDAAAYNFVSNAGFRFRCDASGNNDQIYIDQVTITGRSGGGTLDNLALLGNGPSYSVLDTTSQDLFEDDFKIYPNPVAGNILYVKLLDDSAVSYRIVNMIGQTVLSGDLKAQQINVESLRSGMYFVEINDGEETMIKKFIKE